MAKGKYTEWLEPDNLLRLEAWTRDGALDKEIADAIGVNPATICEWKNRFPEFAKALKRGKEVVDIQVENKLLSRAMGFDYDEVKEEYDDCGELIKRTVIKKKVLPDTVAQFFWLKNRKPDVWRDKRVIETTEQIDKLDETLKAIKESGSFISPPKDDEVD